MNRDSPSLFFAFEFLDKTGLASTAFPGECSEFVDKQGRTKRAEQKESISCVAASWKMNAFLLFSCVLSFFVFFFVAAAMAEKKPSIHFRAQRRQGRERKATKEKKEKEKRHLSLSLSLRRDCFSACLCCSPSGPAQAHARERLSRGSDSRAETTKGEPTAAPPLPVSPSWRRWTASRTPRRPSSASRPSNLASWTLTLS